MKEYHGDPSKCAEMTVLGFPSRELISEGLTDLEKNWRDLRWEEIAMIRGVLHRLLNEMDLYQADK